MGTLYLHIDQEVGRMGPKMLMMMLVWSCAVLCGSARRRTPADPCIQSCKRPIIRVPTCGSDGRNYNSLCDACRHGTEARCVGRCPCDARCKRKCSLFPRRPQPVCTADGRKFPNECIAECLGERIICRPGCYCPWWPKRRRNLPVFS